MSAKTSADVLIGGKIYTLSGYESEDYLQKVANYINNKINEFDEMEQFRRFPGEMKATLVELNIADDYFKAKDQAEKLEQDVKEKEKEIYELKHELISLKIAAESSEKSTTELEKENRKLLLHKAKLETALEDALLGKVKGQVLPAEKTEPALHLNDQQKKKETESAEHKGGKEKSNEKVMNANSGKTADAEKEKNNERSMDARKERDSKKVINAEKEEKNKNEDHSV